MFVVIDPDNVIAETDEDNNIAALKVTVKNGLIVRETKILEPMVEPRSIPRDVVGSARLVGTWSGMAVDKPGEGTSQDPLRLELRIHESGHLMGEAFGRFVYSGNCKAENLRVSGNQLYFEVRHRYKRMRMGITLYLEGGKLVGEGIPIDIDDDRCNITLERESQNRTATSRSARRPRRVSGEPKILEPSGESNRAQILIDFKLFGIPVELARKELGWVPKDPGNEDPRKTGGIIVKMGQEYAGRLERLCQGKGDRLLTSPHVLILDGEEGVFSAVAEYPYIAGYEMDDQTGQPKKIVKFADGGIVLKVTGTIQDADRKTIKLDMNFDRKKPSLTTQQHQDGYEYHIPVMDSQVVNTTCLVENGQPLIIGGFEGEGMVLYLEMTSKVMPPGEVDSQGKQNRRTSRGFAGHAKSRSLAERMNQPITYQCTEQPIGTVLGQLAEWADVDIIKSEEIQGSMTFKVTKIPLKEVLCSILAAHGWGYVQTENMIRVAPLSEISTKGRSMSRVAGRKKAFAEVVLAKDYKVVNYTVGRSRMMITMEVAAKVKSEQKEQLEAEVKEYNKEILNAIRIVVAGANPDDIKRDPRLQVIKRDIRTGVENIVSEGLVKEILIPVWQPYSDG